LKKKFRKGFFITVQAFAVGYQDLHSVYRGTRFIRSQAMLPLVPL
jgi:hypothetical protein